MHHDVHDAPGRRCAHGVQGQGGDSGAPDPVDPARTSHGPVAADIAGPMGTPWPTATAEQQATFDRGIEVMEHRFDYGEGLGPAFNVTFCGSCRRSPCSAGRAACTGTSG